MIEMQYNFPLLPGQGVEWHTRLRQAVEQLHPDDAGQLRPTFRISSLGHRNLAAAWLGSPPERTWIVCGGHHGTLVSLLAAGLAGRPIAVEAVTYTGILEQARMLGSPLLGLDYDGEGLLPGALRAACARGPVSAVYTMPAVHNPLGCVASLERRQAIVAVARDFDLLLIEDDAYGYMEPGLADKGPPPSYAVLAPERTFYVRGLSKSYAPATLTGLLVAPERFAASIENAVKNSTTGTSLPHNAAALSLLADGTLDRVIAAKLAEGARRNAAARAVLGNAAAPGPASAWHLWVTVPMSGEEAQWRCQQLGALVSGAHGFTVPGTTPPNAIRIALGGELDASRTQAGVEIVATACAL
jgi:DNA-binding transcriptional MocR family regulator